jgi:hypothetical protein
MVFVAITKRRKGQAMKLVIASCLLFAVPGLLSAQEVAKKPSFMDAGIVEHRGASGILTANNPRPLFQAIDAIGQEYGWTIDFEDPPYQSHFDLVDRTDPEWRSSHPNAKGVTRVAGGAFQSSFPEPSTIVSEDAREQVLRKSVSDYNSSGNPGKFIVRKEAEGRYAVIGVSRKGEAGQDETVPVLLDSPITIPVQQRSAAETLQLIVERLSATSGVKVLLGSNWLSSDPLEDAEVSVGGTKISARTLLSQTLDEANKSRLFRWDLLFDADEDAYYLRLSTVTKAQIDDHGRRIPQPLDRTSATQ